MCIGSLALTIADFYCFVFTISFVANIGEKGLILDQCMTISV
jgi:hypothetical protein